MHDIDKLRDILVEASAIVIDGDFFYIMNFCSDDDELITEGDELVFTLEDLANKKIKVLSLQEVSSSLYKEDDGGQISLI